MTKREFLQAIENGVMNDEVKAFATAEIAKMDAKNEARKAKPSKASVENAPLKLKMLELLEDAPMIGAELAEVLEVSTQKITAIGRQLADEGKVEISDVKVPKKGKRKLYTLIVSLDNENQFLDKEVTV